MPTPGAKGQTTVTIKKLMDGKLRLETRNSNPIVYARTRLQNKNLVFRTKETRIQQAEKAAIDWWFAMMTHGSFGSRSRLSTRVDQPGHTRTYWWPQWQMSQ